MAYKKKDLGLINKKLKGSTVLPGQRRLTNGGTEEVVIMAREALAQLPPLPE